MKKHPMWLLAAAAILLATVSASPLRAGEGQAEKKSESKMTKTSSGLQYEDVTAGTGASPRSGQTCVMHYTGWLWENGAKGKKFDSSVDRGTPFEFPLGQGRVIKGWDEGVAGMKVGGRRRITIPPMMGYGKRGAPPVIGPDETLVFVVDLVGVR